MSTTQSRVRSHADAALEHASIMFPAIVVLLVAGDRATGRLREQDRQLGASIAETLVITAILIAIALAIGATLKTKFTGKADNLDLTTP